MNRILKMSWIFVMIGSSALAEKIPLEIKGLRLWPSEIYNYNGDNPSKGIQPTNEALAWIADGKVFQRLVGKDGLIETLKVSRSNKIPICSVRGFLMPLDLAPKDGKAQSVTETFEAEVMGDFRMLLFPKVQKGSADFEKGSPVSLEVRCFDYEEMEFISSKGERLIPAGGYKNGFTLKASSDVYESLTAAFGNMIPENRGAPGKGAAKEGMR